MSVTATKKRSRTNTRGKSSIQAKIRAVAKESFGFTSFRNGQEAAIEHVLAGRDTLVVQPTGSGKSAIYQIAGLILEGSILVISPLIALQKDQRDTVSQFEEEGEAAVLNSAQRMSERSETLNAITGGDRRFVFLAPEQLAREDTREALSEAQIAMIVIDEAHCISEWGHDFRPDYLKLGQAVDALHHPVVLALTATASARVRSEIVERLGMRNPAILVGGFDRPNLHLRVDRFKEADEKKETLLHRVQWASKPGIVYVGTRKAAELLAAEFREVGVNALFYHGGMKPDERAEVQERFMSGKNSVMVATNAFGMGIDKSDIRFVYHFDAPESLDAYYQEIGRAGRDGKRADVILYFRDADIGAQAFHTGAGKAQAKEAATLLEAFQSRRRKLSTEQLLELTGFSKRKLTSILQKLVEVDAVEIRDEEVRVRTSESVESILQSVEGQQQSLSEAARERLEEMRSYAETTGCRRQHLLGYFGQTYEAPCDFCDNCEEAHPQIEVDPSEGTRREVA